MLATPEDEMAGTMSFASVTDAVAVAMDSGARNIVHLLLTSFF
jgi:methyl coenzyme M reductase subunit C